MNFLWSMIAVVGFAGSVLSFYYVLRGRNIWDAD